MYLDKERRIITLVGDIEDSLADQFAHAFLELDHYPGEIKILISSFGGTYDTAAVSMIDLMLGSNNHITTYVYGAAASSGAFLALAGDSRYFSSERSYLMIHPGSSDTESMDLRDFEKNASVIKHQMEQDCAYFSSRSNRPSSFFKEALDSGDTYYFAEKAIELGLIQGIKTING